MTQPHENYFVDGAQRIGRVPPHSEDAERSLLGGILLDREAPLEELANICTVADFYFSKHRKVFEAMLSLLEDGIAVDRVSLIERLTERGDLENAGGGEYVELLDKFVPHAGDLAYYAEIIADKAKARRLIEAGSFIAQLGYETHGDVGEFAAEAQRRILTATEGLAQGSIDDRWAPFTENEIETDPPPREYIVEPYLPVAEVAHLSGLGGGAKTTLTLALAAARAHGRKFFGHSVKPGKTLFVTLEDRRAEYRRKLAALRAEARCAGVEWNSRVIAECVIPLDLRGLGFRFVEWDHGRAVVSPSVDELARLIRRRAPDADLVVCETLSRLTGGAEGNDANSTVISAAERLSSLIGDKTPLLVGHVGQEAARSGETGQHAGRGGTALGDNARSTLIMAKLTKENAEQLFPGARLWSRPEEERDRLLILRHPKAIGPTADPILLERRANQHGPFLVQPQLVVPRTASERNVADFVRLRKHVADANAAGRVVTAGSLRPRFAEFGQTSEKTMRVLVDDAIDASWLLTDATRKAPGGGKPLIPGPGQAPAESPADRRTGE